MWLMTMAMFGMDSVSAGNFGHLWLAVRQKYSNCAFRHSTVMLSVAFLGATAAPHNT
jgi:hypothetical protein